MFSHIKEFFTRPSGAYKISRSVRLRSSASAYFNRTLTTPTLGTKWTWSGWCKLGTVGTRMTFFSAGSSNGHSIALDNTTAANANLALYSIGTGTSVNVASSNLLRDPSSWYHIMVVVDTTQATASNRVLLYVNGVAVTAFAASTYPAQNSTLTINASGSHDIGRRNDASLYYDGYLTEINFIDGQALTPSSFGSTNAVTGIWQPIKYAGTYGTNGFYLNFSDNSSNTATTIGKDYSGNGNNWTPNNISVTAGVTYDSMVDSPTVGATSSNYAVLNPLKKPSTSTITDGNLNVAWTVTGGEQPASFAQSSGKWYWEQTQNAGVAAPGIILDTAVPSANSITQGYHYYGGNGQFYTATTGVAYGATFTTGDVIGVALDLDNNQITFYKNNTSQGTKTIAAGSYTPDFASAGTITINANFGQRPFTYTPPTGFVALNTQNLPTPTISNGANYMAATLYTGNGTTTNLVNSVNGVSFKPDLVWQKNRSSAANNILVDSVRGGSLYLISNTTGADASAPGYMTFNSNGESFTSSDITTNQSGQSYVAWQWQAGAGSTVSNTSGSITSTVSAGATQGFSVVTYTGNGGSNQSVGHGLGVTPGMVIIKQRDGTANWLVHHQSQPTGYTLYLNLTNAQDSGTSQWGTSAQTSSVFYIGYTVGATGSNVNASAYVAYCFSAVAGYSAFGSYTGNGSTDGPFIYTGFRPRFVMLKRTDVANDWAILDTARNTFNVTTQVLFPNSSVAEGTQTTPMDILSNGFKVRNGADNYINANGGTYVYACFAENPFKYSLAR